MKHCHFCQAEILFEESQFCEHCGTPLEPSPENEDMDIEVSERCGDNRDNKGGHSLKPANDELGVRTDAELVESLAFENTDADPAEPPGSLSKSPVADKNATGKLSIEQIKSIEKNLYNSSTYLSDSERQQLLSKIDNSAKSARQKGADGPAELRRPAMAGRGRGVAYYMRNFVQLQGEVSLREDEELLVNDRVYVLRKKPFTPKTIITVGAALLTLLAVVFIPVLVRDASTNDGEIMGVVLDSNHQPVTRGAAIRFPESGRTVQANGQGLFRSGQIPPGAHKIEYLVNEAVVASDYATVAADKVTMIALAPAAPPVASLSVETAPDTETHPTQAAVATPDSGPEPARPAGRPAPSQPKNEVSGYGSITLAANVDGARFQIDGSVLGAGNLTYQSVKAGTRRYTVSKEGYQPVSGTLDLTPGSTEVLSVALAPLNQTQPVKQHDNAYQAAAGLLRAGELTQAVAAFDAIIAEHPGHVEAYVGRAQAYERARNRVAAHDDYLRAAEILRMNNSTGEALTAFNNAVKMDEKSIAAYLGRGSLYLSRHEAIAAIADYETVLKLDKKNSQAHLGLGEARLSQGNHKQASKHLKDARSLDPNNPIIYQRLMLCYFSDDDFKNVRKSYDKFKEVATQEQLAQFHADDDYAGVLRLVDME